jgi:hypothetical protein
MEQWSDPGWSNGLIRIREPGSGILHPGSATLVYDICIVKDPMGEKLQFPFSNGFKLNFFTF